MDKLRFQSSPEPTLGVEVELALVNAQTFALESAMPRLREAVPETYREHIKPELMQCYVEINTGICRTATEAGDDLRQKIAVVNEAARALGLRVMWCGTHPFSLWQDQHPTEDERYQRLLDNLQEMGRRLVAFGLHVHVGVDSGDKAVMICERMMRHLPTLLALSCNSPFWNNRLTGMRSYRTKVMEGLPTAGLPTLMRNWSEYVWLVNHCVDTGFISSIRDIWWDVRPHHNFGTVEVRICDIPGSLDDTLGIVALTHALVVALSDQIDKGAYQRDFHPMMVSQNKWRALRYGLDAQLVDLDDYRRRPAREVVARLVDRLRPTAANLGCEDDLDRVVRAAKGPTWADRQLDVYENSGDARDVARFLVESAEAALERPQEDADPRRSRPRAAS